MPQKGHGVFWRVASMSDVRHYKAQVQVVITMSLFEIRDLGVIIRFSQKKARIEMKVNARKKKKSSSDAKKFERRLPCIVDSYSSAVLCLWAS